MMTKLDKILSKNGWHYKFHNEHGIRIHNNCYSYALNCSHPFYLRIPRPGFYTDKKNGFHPNNDQYTHLNLRAAIRSDGALYMGCGSDIPTPAHGHYIIAALQTKVLESGENTPTKDYHFYRQYTDKTWGERKCLRGLARNLGTFKSSDDFIRDFITSDPAAHEAIFVGWFQIPNAGLDITINKIIYDIYTHDPDLLMRAGIPTYFIQGQLDIYKNRQEIETSNDISDREYFKRYSDCVCKHDSITDLPPQYKESLNEKIQQMYQLVTSRRASPVR